MISGIVTSFNIPDRFGPGWVGGGGGGGGGVGSSGCDVPCNRLLSFSSNFILFDYFLDIKRCFTSIKYFISYNEFLNLL